MWSCPCGMARAGACLTAWCVYWVCVSGWPPMLAHIERGDGEGVLWVMLAIFGIGGLLLGIREALRHNDVFNGESFLWSVAVIALGVFALRGAWYLDDSMLDWHLSRAFWFGWMASNAVNIWLQLRGMRRREVVRPGERVTSEFSFRWFRRMRETKEWSEEIEARRLGALPSPPLRHAVSPVIEQTQALPPVGDAREGYGLGPMRLPAPPGTVEQQPRAAPQIVYVKQGDGLVPVLLPSAREFVERRDRDGRPEHADERV